MRYGANGARLQCCDVGCDVQVQSAPAKPNKINVSALLTCLAQREMNNLR
jgi:hypothetical protein